MFLGVSVHVIMLLCLLLQAVVKDYVELSFDQLPSIMEFLYGLLTQEGPVIVYTHCEVSGRREEGGGEGKGGREGEGRWVGGKERRGWKGGGGGEVGRKRRVEGRGEGGESGEEKKGRVGRRRRRGE